MIRLLSRQPIDAGEDRTIAELHIACFALNPVRGNAWVDLRSDLHGRCPAEIQEESAGAVERYDHG